MPLLENLIAQIIDRKKALDTLRSQSPEIAEALAVSDEYHNLMNELIKACSTSSAPFWSVPQLIVNQLGNDDVARTSRLQIIK